MKTKDVKIGGCCMGIPFGCGTLMALALIGGGIAGYFPLSGTFFLTALLTTVAGLALLAAVLIVTEGVRESRAGFAVPSDPPPLR